MSSANVLLVAHEVESHHGTATDDSLESSIGLARDTAARSGSLTVIIGPMFAGKTSELLRHIDSYEVLYFPHA